MQINRNTCAIILVGLLCLSICSSIIPINPASAVIDATVVFKAVGLKPGTTFSLSYGLTPYSTTSDTITVGVEHGIAMIYLVNLPHGYTSNSTLYESAYTMEVGGTTTYTFEFTELPKYTVTFNQTGLSAGQSWSVRFDGVTHSSTTNQISFTSIYDTYTYDYTINAVNGYTCNSATSGQITLAGGNYNQDVSFTQNHYNVTVNTVGSGFVTRSPEQETYLYGTSVQLTANPASGWSFGGWSGDMSGSTNPKSITLNANKTVTATFTQNSYTLTIITVGQGSVSLGNHSYLSNTEVDLKAMNSAGWTFAGWSGDASGSENTTITMDGNKVVTATFSQDSYTLTMITVGQGSVTPGNQTYLSNSVIDLQAFNAAGWTFSGWSGATSGDTNKSITLTGNLTVTATFTQDIYPLTLIIIGNGTVTPGNKTYLSGTTVDIAAINDYGWTFSGWSGDASGQTNTSITMNGPMTITAVFSINNYTITVTQTSHGSITPGTSLVNFWSNKTFAISADEQYHILDVIVDGESKGAISSWEFANVESNHNITATFAIDTYNITVVSGFNGTVSPSNTTVNSGSNPTFTITPDTGYHVANVTVDGISKGAITSWQFTDIRENHNITAIFEINRYTLTVIQTNNGTITPNSTIVDYNTAQNFTITPQIGFHIVQVTVDGQQKGPISSWAFTEVNANHTITATYLPDEYTLELRTVGSGSAVNQNVKATYRYGDVVPLNALAYQGWTFNGWTGDLASVNPAASITMTGNKTVTAIFTQDVYTLTVITVGQGIVNPGNSSYLSGTSVDLSASDVQHWTFSSWTGDASGSKNTTVTMNGNLTVTAVFTQITYPVTFTLTGVDSDYTGKALTIDGTEYSITDLSKTFVWASGSVHSFSYNTALAASNSKQYVWVSTSGLSTTQDGSLTVSGPGNVTANFGVQYLLTVTSSQGTVSGSGWYNAASSATVAVSQSTVTSGIDTRYVFDGWSGAAQGTQSSVSVVMAGPKTVVANWETQYRVTVTANPSSGGTTTPSSATWMPVGTLEISCTANPGYQFTSWSSTTQVTIATPTSTAATATINGPGTITANFNQTIETVYIKTADGKTKELAMSGNISASQLSNPKITTSLGTQTTKISFTATGPSGTVGFTNMTIPKSTVTYGTKPVIYIDGEAAANQGYAQDYYNYYVWFTTHFSEHEISIEFTQNETTPTQPSTSNLVLPAALAVAIIVIVLSGLLVNQRRKHKN